MVRQGSANKIHLAIAPCASPSFPFDRGVPPVPSILVTGASRGIGHATSLALGRAGHRVFATMRDPAGTPELAEAAERESLPVVVSRMDVDSDDSVRTAVGRIIAEHGLPDVLVNNAGIVRRGSIEETPLDDFRAAMETNYFGAIRCTQAVLPGMRARRSGVIINVSSVAGRVANPPMGPYAASKFALEGLSEALAQEVKPFGIRVVLVEPGIIDTAMARSVTRPSDTTIYPHSRAMADIFTAALSVPVAPELVAETIRKIIEGDSWQFRYLVGPDAAPLIAWRASLTDEEFIAGDR